MAYDMEDVADCYTNRQGAEAEAIDAERERIDDGGPAYPVEWTDMHPGHPGMSVRTWLAGERS